MSPSHQSGIVAGEFTQRHSKQGLHLGQTLHGVYWEERCYVESEGKGIVHILEPKTQCLLLLLLLKHPLPDLVVALTAAA